MGDDKLAIKDSITVEKGIFKRIQMLSGLQENSPQSDAISSRDAQRKDVINKVRCLDVKAEQGPLIWMVNDNIGVLCEAVATRTDHVARKNNIDMLLEHLNRQYGDRYIVVSFRRSSITKSFKRCIVFDDVQFNITDPCQISKIAKLMFDLGGERVMLIEMKNGKEGAVLFILACILCYNKIFWSAESALSSLLMSNPLHFEFKNTETMIRYARYYDQIEGYNATHRFPQKILNQIIITTIPTILKRGSYQPRLKVSCRLKSATFSLEKCYIDKDYIIFSNLDTPIIEDTVISLYFAQENEVYHIFDLRLNTYFYQQGLHRFTRADIETLLPQDSIYEFFDENFYVDVVMIENGELQSLIPYTTAYDVADVAKFISEKYLGEGWNNASLQRLLELGYNQDLARVCALLGFRDEESERLRQPYIDRFSAHKCPQIVETSNKAKSKAPEADALQDAKIVPEVNYRSIYQTIEEIEIVEIPLIDNAVSGGLFNKKGTSRLFGKKQTIEIPVNESLYSIKPIHINPLQASENTIFSETQDISVKINLQEFESYFCERQESKAVEMSEIPAESQKTLIEQKRLFIISICMKQLEMKRISIDEVFDIVKQTPSAFTMEELTNILWILPTADEKALLENTAESLGSVETTMLRLSAIPDLKQVISLLIFETWFFEEILKIEQSIKDYRSAIKQLLSNNELKIMFRVLLEISNLINYVYGRKRKFAVGFRIESLYLFTTYLGNNGHTLLDFTGKMLIRNNMRLSNFRLMVEYINQIKREDIMNIKESINGVIVRYTESKHLLGQIEHYDKGDFGKLLSYACKKLQATVGEYKDLDISINQLKRKMGEDVAKPVSGMLENMHTFCVKLLESMEKNSQRKKG